MQAADERAAYHSMFEWERNQLRNDRAGDSRRRVYVDHSCYITRDMSDADIDRVAWRLAERAMNRAAWERTYADAETRRRKSEAA